MLIKFSHANEELVGTLFIPQIGIPPYPGVIFFHGMTSNEKNYVPMAQVYYDNAISTKRREFEILDGAEHSLQNDAVRAAFTQLLTQWFGETL